MSGKMVENIDEQAYLNQIIDELRENIGCDFVGLAFQEDRSPNITWQYANGQSNNKYQRISVRYGKGIAGRVISTGSPFLIEHFPAHILGKALEYPIMLAEKLLYAYAVPILINHVPKGVLLVGNRNTELLDEHDKQIVNAAAHSIERFIQLK